MTIELIYCSGIVLTMVITALWHRYIPNNMIGDVMRVNLGKVNQAAAIIILHLAWPITLLLIMVSAAYRLWAKMAGIKLEEE